METEEHYPTPEISSEDEVWKRLDRCENSTVIDELYTYGQSMLKDSVDRIRALETRATTFAAYGLAVVTLLFSDASSLTKIGNQWSLWTALASAICGVCCVFSSVRVLSIRKIGIASEDEWLNTKCLSEPLDDVKKFRIVMTWRSLKSRLAANKEKSRAVAQAEVWLGGAALFAVYLLIHIAFLHTFSNRLWAFLEGCIPHKLGIQAWPNLGGGLFCGLILGLTLFCVYGRARRV